MHSDSPDSPWGVLGVAPDCPPDVLKQTYARLLKLHRPDKDPEGFRRIRDAYEFMRDNAEFCKAMAAREAEESEHEPDDDTPESSDAAPEVTSSVPHVREIHVNPLPANQMPRPERVQVQPVPTPRRRWTTLRKISFMLKSARKAKNKEKHRRALKLLLKFWRKKKTQSDAWDRLVLRELFRRKSRILKLMVPADAGRDIERESQVVATQMIRAYARIAAWPTVLNILIEIEKKLPIEAAAMALVFGARQVALLDWKRAQELADKAYPHLPAYARHAGLGDLDRLIQGGKEIATMNAKDRSVLARCLADEKADPEDEAVKVAFRNLTFSRSAPAARTYLSEHFPDFKNKLKVKPLEPLPAPSSRSSSSSSSGIASYWWVIILLISLTRGFGACNSTSSSNYNYSPPKPTFNNAEFKEVSERLKKGMDNGEFKNGMDKEAIKKIVDEVKAKRQKNTEDAKQLRILRGERDLPVKNDARPPPTEKPDASQPTVVPLPSK